MTHRLDSTFQPEEKAKLVSEKLRTSFIRVVVGQVESPTRRRSVSHPTNLNPQQHSCENLKSRILKPCFSTIVRGYAIPRAKKKKKD
jgi:hypothetical protein